MDVTAVVSRVAFTVTTIVPLLAAACVGFQLEAEDPSLVCDPCAAMKQMPAELPADPDERARWAEVGPAMSEAMERFTRSFEELCPTDTSDCTDSLERAFAEMLPEVEGLMQEAIELDIESCGHFHRYYGLRGGAVARRFIMLLRAGRILGGDAIRRGNFFVTGLGGTIGPCCSIGPPP